MQPDIIQQRLANQQISQTNFTSAEELLKWFVAMQAQEFAHVKWAIALRIKGLTDASIEKSFNEGRILRTHLMRPTWHFVSPEDIHWLLKLTAPRVHIANTFMYRKLELDAKLFSKSNIIIAKCLEGGQHLTRLEINSFLAKEKIIAEGHRLSYLMMFAELEGLICSGIRREKQFTYALTNERVSPQKDLSMDEALHKLCTAYFKSRGPATLQDFVWWSGLTVKDAKKGIATLDKTFERFTKGDREYIYILNAKTDIDPYNSATFLLPDYDEYGISYKFRDDFVNRNFEKGKSIVYTRAIIVDGVYGGSWSRSVKNNKVFVDVAPFDGLTKAQLKAVEQAATNYRAFVAKSTEE